MKINSTKIAYNITIVFVAIILLQSCYSTPKKVASTNLDHHKDLDSLLRTAVLNEEIPGVVAYISQHGHLIYHKAFGFQNIANKTPMQTNSIFRMASMTKALTAVAILQLVERGLLQLDDEIEQYLPEFKNRTILSKMHPDSTFSSIPTDQKITIRQLLTHTSGIGYGFQNEQYNALILKNNISEGFEDDDRTSYDNIQRIAQLPLLHQPGEKNTYGLSYDVLGVLIEKISNMRYDQYIKRYILKPLDMNDSYFTIPEREQHRIPSVYQPSETANGLETASYPDTIYPVIKTKQYFSGGADLCSTAEDYAKFIRMIKNKGIHQGKHVLGERYIDMMLSKQTDFDDEEADQGFATWVTNKKGAAKGPLSLGSFGFGGFFDTYSWVDPQHDFVAVLLIQMYPNNQHHIHEKFQAITYGIIE